MLFDKLYSLRHTNGRTIALEGLSMLHTIRIRSKNKKSKIEGPAIARPNGCDAERLRCGAD